jgi:hypothetical protein
MHPGQSKVQNVWDKGRIPKGVFRRIWQHHTDSLSRAFAGTDLTDYDAGEPIDVQADLLPPTHIVRDEKMTYATLWHRRLGHRASHKLTRTAKHVNGLKPCRDPTFCSCCARSSMQRIPANKHVALRPQASKPLGQVSIDLIEYTHRAGDTQASLHGAKYAAVFIDGFSRYSYVVPMRTKDESLHALKLFIQEVGKPDELLTDCDSVFLGDPFRAYCTDHAIRQRETVPHSHWMHGLCERGNKELKTMAKALLIDSGLPPQFWAHALLTASHLKNRTAGVKGQTPYQLMTPVSHGRVPDVGNLRIFGSPCYAFVEKSLRRPDHHNCVSNPGIFIGYAPRSNGYLVYMPATRRVVVRDTIRCDEGYNGGVDVLKGVYDRTPTDITEYTFADHDAAPTPKPPRITQADVTKFFAPSVQIPDKPGINTNKHKASRRILYNTCTPSNCTATYIAERCAKIDGLTFQQVRSKIGRFVSSDGSYRAYTKRDLDYDIRAGHLSYQPTPTDLTHEELTYHRANLAATHSVCHSYSLVHTGDEPLTRKEAKLRNDWDLWSQAEQEEWQALWDAGCFEWVNADGVDPRKVLTGRYVYKQKPDRKKARLIIRGFLQDYRDIGDTYSPVCRMETVRTVLSHAAKAGWSVRLSDIKNAYVRSDVQSEVYMRAPEGHDRDHPGKILKLHKSLYGLRSSGRSWYLVIKRYLESQGLRASSADPCLYYNKDKSLIICLYVDDVLALGAPDQTASFMKALGQRFEIRDYGDQSKFSFLGIEITRTLHSIRLTQCTMIETLMKRFSLTPTHVSSPMAHDAKITDLDDANLKPDHTEYRSLCGALNYICTSTRPDCSYAIHQLCRKLSNPSFADLRAARRVLQYLHSTRHDGLTYDARMSDAACAYTDADYANQIDNRRSVSGRCIMLHGAAIMWSSKQQSVVALSTAESEYIAASDAAKDCLWMRKLLRDLGHDMSAPTLLHEDNTAAMKWATDSSAWSKTRHIDVKFHAIREWVEDGAIKLVYCPTAAQLADGLTKALPPAMHKHSADMLLNRQSIEDTAPAA